MFCLRRLHLKMKPWQLFCPNTRLVPLSIFWKVTENIWVSISWVFFKANFPHTGSELPEDFFSPECSLHPFNTVCNIYLPGCIAWAWTMWWVLGCRPAAEGRSPPQHPTPTSTPHFILLTHHGTGIYFTMPTPRSQVPVNVPVNCQRLIYLFSLLEAL